MSTSLNAEEINVLRRDVILGDGDDDDDVWGWDNSWDGGSGTDGD